MRLFPPVSFASQGPSMKCTLGTGWYWFEVGNTYRERSWSRMVIQVVQRGCRTHFVWSEVEEVGYGRWCRAQATCATAWQRATASRIRSGASTTPDDACLDHAPTVVADYTSRACPARRQASPPMARLKPPPADRKRTGSPRLRMT